MSFIFIKKFFFFLYIYSSIQIQDNVFKKFNYLLTVLYFVVLVSDSSKTQDIYMLYPIELLKQNIYTEIVDIVRW